MSELKPCPFCGGEPGVFECFDHSFSVACLECNANIGDVDTREKAIELWNRRVEE